MSEKEHGYWVHIPVRKNKVRKLFITKSAYARRVQRKIAIGIAVGNYFLRACACGQWRSMCAYTPGTGVHDHVLTHMRTAHEYASAHDSRDLRIIKLDVRDCFNSTSYAHLGKCKSVLKHLSCSPHTPAWDGISYEPACAWYTNDQLRLNIYRDIVAPVLGALDKRRLLISAPTEDTRVLAQGIRTSPHLTNLIMYSAELRWQRRLCIAPEHPLHVPALLGANNCRTHHAATHCLRRTVLAYTRYADDVLITTVAPPQQRDTLLSLLADEFAECGLEFKYALEYAYGERVQVCGYSWTVGQADIRPSRRTRRRLRALEHINAKYGDSKGGQLQFFRSWSSPTHMSGLGKKSKAAKLIRAYRAAYFNASSR